MSYPNKFMIGLPVVKVREMPLASWGLLMGMSRASDHSESPETERKATEPHEHEVTLATPLHLLVQVGNPRVEVRLVMRAAGHAIADPHGQHLAAVDALSWPIVGLSFLEPHSCHDRLTPDPSPAGGEGRKCERGYPNKSMIGLPVVNVREMPLAS